jgi:hypothetical protein
MFEGKRIPHSFRTTSDENLDAASRFLVLRADS